MPLIAANNQASLVYEASEVAYDDTPASDGGAVSPDLTESAITVHSHLPQGFFPANRVNIIAASSPANARVYYRYDAPVGWSWDEGDLLVWLLQCDDNGNFKDAAVDQSLHLLVRTGIGPASTLTASRQNIILGSVSPGKSKRQTLAIPILLSEPDMGYTGDGGPDFGLNFQRTQTLGGIEWATGPIHELGFLGLYRIPAADIPNNKYYIETHDDGYDEVHSIVYPKSQALNQKFVVGIIRDRVGFSGSFLTWDQCTEMKQSGLVEFANHSDTPADNWQSLSGAALDAALDGCMDELEARGLVSADPSHARSAIAPFGALDNESRDALIARNYQCCRGTRSYNENAADLDFEFVAMPGDPGFLNPFDLHSINMGVDPPTDSAGSGLASELTAFATAAWAKGGIPIYRCHNIVESAPSGQSQILRSEYEQWKDDMDSNGGQSITLADVAVMTGQAQGEGGASNLIAATRRTLNGPPKKRIYPKTRRGGLRGL